MKPKLLLVTNQDNSDPEEDQFLAKELEADFQVNITGLTEVADYSEPIDLVLVRNIWPIGEQMKLTQNLYQHLQKQNIPVYNDYSGSGDMQGKSYLVMLAKENYPVISSALINQSLELPASAEYIIKPIYGGNSEGVRKVKIEELSKHNSPDYIIQPYLDIFAEYSFYYIDGDYQYSLTTERPKDRWDLIPYSPTNEELLLTQKFIDWNTLEHGITRLDFVRTTDGEFLLLEIEDWCPYLSLAEAGEETTKKFVESLKQSLKKTLSHGYSPIRAN